MGVMHYAPGVVVYLAPGEEGQWRITHQAIDVHKKIAILRLWYNRRSRRGE